MKPLFIILSLLSCAAYSQQLTGIQKNSLRAPANIKIDGNAIEWGNEFQAYNKATNLYYSIANDEQNLYLIIHATDPVIISKTLSGGITFIINKSGKKSDENTVSITYPVIDANDKPNVNFKNIPQIIPGDKRSVLKADSFVNENNRRVTNKFKWIRITGIKGLDTLTSVYNRDGVNAAGLFDNKMAYTYELKIDLKHLGLPVQNPEKFAYHIISNGIDLKNLDGLPTPVHGASSSPGGLIPNTNQVLLSSVPSIPHGGYHFNREDFMVLVSATDFWGEYTLAKK